MIVLRAINPKYNLSKEIDATEYSLEEMAKTYSVYMRAGYNVYVKKGIEHILKLRCVRKKRTGQ